MNEMGFDAHLKCLTVGRHSTVWMGPDEQPISDSDKFKIMPDGSLVIHDLDFNDMGVYVCIAKNQFGHDMAETFVYPVAVSQPPSFYRLVVNVLTWLWLLFTRHSKNLIQNSYFFSWVPLNFSSWAIFAQFFCAAALFTFWVIL